MTSSINSYGYVSTLSAKKYQLKNRHKMIIACPVKFGAGVASDFATTLLSIYSKPAYEEFSIDFSSIGFIDPFSCLVLAHGLKQFLNLRQKYGLETKCLGLENPFGVTGYLKHIGFFRFCGIPTGKDIGEAAGSSNYLPITKIRRDQIMWKGHVMQKEIDNKADGLATVMFPGAENAGPAMMLGYAIREIIRNSFEHGQVSECAVVAQRWANGDAEIAIGDEGIGVYYSLAKTGHYATPEKAIEACLLPGVTSQSVTGDSVWANSGFGLYVVSELGKRFGSFEIISSGQRVFFDALQQKTRPTSLMGTFVKLRVSTIDADYFPNILQQIVFEGEEKAKSLPGTVKSASKVSKTPTLSNLPV